MNELRWPPPPDGFPRRQGRPRRSGPTTGRPVPPIPPTDVIETSQGVRLEQLITGSGTPTTVFAHGLGQGIGETRPLGSAVTGRKVFFQFRGHGGSASPPGPWDYGDLARDLRAAADGAAATRALGVSLGAGALCRLLAETPDRFEKVVFFLPAVLDRPRPDEARRRLIALLEAIEAGDLSAVADVIVEELPPGARNGASGWAYVRQRLHSLMNSGLSSGLLSLPDQVAVPDVNLLRDVTAQALVIGCADDPMHPVEVAQELASVLPDARLHLYDRPAVLWNERSDLRTRISSFLNE